MNAGAIVWAALLGALLALFVGVARRMSAMIGRTRDLERLQRSVESIDRRFGAVAEPLVARLDGLIRRQAADAEGLAREVDPARATLRDLAAEAGALQVPPSLAGLGSVLVHETERAVRAADLVAHGLEAMLAARGRYGVQDQTSLKRGALNLRHARDAFGRAAAEIAALRPTDLAPGAPGAAAGPSPRGVAAYGADPDSDLEGPFEPRM